jgi:hypothetical protein
MAESSQGQGFSFLKFLMINECFAMRGRGSRYTIHVTLATKNVSNVFLSSYKESCSLLYLHICNCFTLTKWRNNTSSKMLYIMHAKL